MRRDAQLIFSDGQVITANGTTVDSTNVIDTGAVTDHKGTALLSFGPENGKERLIITAKGTPTAGTGLQAELHDCATEGGTYKPTGIGLDAAIPIATLVPGYELLNVPLPRGLMRFLKIVYTTTGNHSGSVGSVNAAIVFGSTTKNQTPYRA
jgi:hypothetical protein